MRRRPRWSRRDRRELEEATASAVSTVRVKVEERAKRTERELRGPTSEEIDLWMKHSHGSWRRDH